MSGVVELSRPDLEVRVTSVIQEARLLIVSDQSSLDAASAFVLEKIKPLIAEAHATFDPICEKAHATWQEAIKQRKRHIEPLEQAESIAKAGISVFIRKQEELRRAEEARLQREAEEKARLERLQAAALARAEEERLRREREEERERLLEQAEREGAPAEEIKALAEAPLEVENAGLADAIASEPLRVEPVRVAPTYQRPAGIVSRETWSAKVWSIRELCKAVGDGRLPESYVSANMTALNARARADRHLLNIPGVRAISDTSVSAR